MLKIKLNLFLSFTTKTNHNVGPEQASGPALCPIRRQDQRHREQGGHQEHGGDER